MKKRVLSLLLAALLLAPALVSCSDNGTTPDDTSASAQTDTPSATSEEAAPAEDELSAAEQRSLLPDNLPDVKFDGRDFVVETETRKVFEILSEELTGEATNDAVYNRNLLIENRFDVKISTVENANPQSEVVTAVTADTHDYDIVGFINFQTYTPVTARVLYNWLDVPNVDLSQPWHNQLANDGATINNKLFAINSDLSISTLLYTYGMFFNYNLMEQAGYSSNDLYNLVFEGNWTVDCLKEITSGMWQDLNGDGKHDKDDIHGYAVINGSINTHDVWLAALDMSPLLKVNGADDYEITFFDEKNVTCLEKINDLYHNSDGTLFDNSGDWRNIPKYFANGKVAMSQLYFGETTESLSEMEDTYGILPLPKLNEEQAAYYTNCWDQFTVFAVPLTMPEADGTFIGTIYEALCAESYKTVFPAYYDVALKSRYSAEPATAEIIDLIMAGRNLDFTFQYGERVGRLPYLFRDMVVENDNGIASKYQKIKKSLNKQIESVLNIYYND